MGKFYVQSGTMRVVVQAESSRKAAVWAIHQAMQQILPMTDSATSASVGAETGAGPENRIFDAPARQVDVLAENVTVSERGFDREDGSIIPTMDVVTEWNQMVTTLARLERLLYPVVASAA